MFHNLRLFRTLSAAATAVPARERYGVASFLAVFLSLSSAFGLSACSPGMFFGANRDDGVANTPSYRRINVACAGLDLASSTLDVPTFRKLLHCFNSNGALEPIENLMNRLPDADVRPIVDVGNRYLLNNRKLLFQMEQTYYTLDQQKILDSTFAQFGRLLENEEFVSSAMALLKEGYTSSRTPFGFSGDQEILQALEHFATKITYDNVSNVIDVGLTLARSRVFGSLQNHFRGDSPSGRNLHDLTDQALQFLQETGDPHHVEAGYQLINELANGDLFQAFDQVLGTNADSFPGSIPRLASVMDATLSNDARIMNGLTSLFHYVHRPIHCLRGAETVPDGAIHQIRELVKRDSTQAASFLKRTGILTLMALDPFCDMPPQLGQYYPAMVALADTTAIEPTADLLRAAWNVSSRDASGAEHHPLAQLLVDILADTGSSAAEFPGGPPENTTGVKLLLPVLAEVTDRHAWNDLLLLLSMPRLEDRASLQEDLRFLIEPIPATNGEVSIYSALLDAVSRATPGDLYNFVYSLRRFTNAPQPILDPALSGLRQAYWVNDVHPVIDIAHDILAEATHNDKLFNTAFIISEMPEFQASVRLVSDMSKDGRLKELSGAVLTLFHKFALQGRTDIHPAKAPAFVARARHDFTELDMGAFPIGDEPALTNNACRQLDLGYSLAEYNDSRYHPQWESFGVCTNADNSHGDVIDLVSLLKDGVSTDRGQKMLPFTIDVVRALDMTTAELKYLGDTFIHSFDKFNRLLDVAKLFTVAEVPGGADGSGNKGPVLRPLFELFRPIMTGAVRPGIEHLQNFAAGVLVRSDFPAIMKYVDDLLDRTPEPVAPQLQQDFDWARIKRWVGNKECEGVPPHAPGSALERYEQQRASQLTDDYNSSITTWDVMLNGQPRRDWEFEEFKSGVNPLITKFGDPKQGVRPGAPLDALLNVMRYFTLADGESRPNAYQHYHRDELRKFLIDRSNDYRLITYFYPGDTYPRVRLVSGMDRLELVLINADFWSPWPFVPGHFLPDFKNHRNFGMLFLAQIADAWGDEDESVWPEEIRDKYRGSRPPTLAQAVASIKKTARTFENLVGLPRLPGCRQEANPSDPAAVQYAETHDPYAHTGGLPSWLPGFHVPLMQRYLFNIHQVLPVLEENLPGRDNAYGADSKYANGMRILRDLFFQLYYSTPEKYRRADFRNTDDGWNNNLSVIMRLVRLGLTRQSTRNLRGMDVNDPPVRDFFNTLIEGATASDDPLDSTPHPRYKAHVLLDPLVDPKLDRMPDDPQHDLLWNVLHPVFGVIDAAEGRALDDIHQKEIQGLPADQAAAVRAEWGKEFLRMKQMSFYTLAQAGPLHLIEPAIKSLGPILSGYSAYLTKHADKVETVLRSKKASYFMRALYEDQDGVNKGRLGSVLQDTLNDTQNGTSAMGALQAIDNDAAATAGWDTASNRWDALVTRPEYLAVHVDELTRGILDFFEEQGTGESGKAAAARMRAYLADRLYSDPQRYPTADLEQYMLWGARDPDGFYQVFRTTGHYIDDGELKEFFQMAHDALSESP